MEKDNVIFPDGVFFNRPRPNAPDFVKGKLSIKAKKFYKFILANPELLNEDGFINIDLKLSKDGKLYLQVDTWKPTPDTAEALSDAPQETPVVDMSRGYPYPENRGPQPFPKEILTEEIDPEDIPF